MNIECLSRGGGKGEWLIPIGEWREGRGWLTYTLAGRGRR
jgi:hypothetical protein